jgi:hypothetical protein
MVNNYIGAWEPRSWTIKRALERELAVSTAESKGGLDKRLPDSKGAFVTAGGSHYHSIMIIMRVSSEHL